MSKNSDTFPNTEKKIIMKTLEKFHQTTLPYICIAFILLTNLFKKVSKHAVYKMQFFEKKRLVGIFIVKLGDLWRELLKRVGSFTVGLVSYT